MYFPKIVVFTSAAAVAATTCPPFPPSLITYSSQFQQPKPPLVKPEFQTHFVQHKWYITSTNPHPRFTLTPSTRNQNLSHIITGYMYNNPSKNHVRVDETFEDGLASSLFDFSNVTKDGLVDNTLTSVFKDFAHPDVWRGYVNTNYPLIAADFLAKNGAVFAGLVDRQFLEGKVASVRCVALHSIQCTLCMLTYL